MKKIRKDKCQTQTALLLVLVAVAAGAFLWYQLLPYSKKRFIQNLVKQAPHLPARYAV